MGTTIHLARHALSSKNQRVVPAIATIFVFTIVPPTTLITFEIDAEAAIESG